MLDFIYFFYVLERIDENARVCFFALLFSEEVGLRLDSCTNHIEDILGGVGYKIRSFCMDQE